MFIDWLSKSLSVQLWIWAFPGSSLKGDLSNPGLINSLWPSWSLLTMCTHNKCTDNFARQEGGKEPEKQAGGVGVCGKSVLLLKHLSPSAFPQAKAVCAPLCCDNFFCSLLKKRCYISLVFHVCIKSALDPVWVGGALVFLPHKRWGCICSLLWLIPGLIGLIWIFLALYEN